MMQKATRQGKIFLQGAILGALLLLYYNILMIFWLFTMLLIVYVDDTAVSMDGDTLSQLATNMSNKLTNISF